MKLAWEDTMLDATEYRAMAAEHHRLAGMCRSPESREQHLRMEKEFQTFAGGEECLHGARADPQIVSAGSCPAALIEGRIVDLPRGNAYVPAAASGSPLQSA
jgi:hypothetical protein